MYYGKTKVFRRLNMTQFDWPTCLLCACSWTSQFFSARLSLLSGNDSLKLGVTITGWGALGITAWWVRLLILEGWACNMLHASTLKWSILQQQCWNICIMSCFKLGGLRSTISNQVIKRGEHFNISLLGKLCCIDNLIIKLHCNNIITF